MKNALLLLFVSILLMSFSRQQTKTPPVFLNTFTPNGDGKNDFFTVENLSEYPNSELTVFTRWGNKVYESSPYKGDWNGACNTCKKGAEKLSDGVYYYIFTDKDTEKQYNGYVNIFY